MKIYSIVFITVILLICLFSEFEAKKVKGEKIKAEKIKEKVAHKHVKPQPDHPRVKPSETTTPTPKVQKVVKTIKHTEKPVDHTVEEVEVIEEVTIEKKPFKPRPPKVLSEYDQCKLECKKKRDQLSAQEYVDHLTEELKQAKEYLAEQEKAAAAQASEHEKTGTGEDKTAEDHLEQTPIVEKPIIEVTLHQTAKDEV